MKLNDVMVCTGSVGFLLLAFVWNPILGFFFSLIIPLPFLYYSSKLGRYQGLALSFIAILSISIIAGLIGHAYFIITGVEVCLLGLLLSELYRRKLSIGFTVFLGTAIMLFFGVIFLFMFEQPGANEHVDESHELSQMELERALNYLEDMGLEEEELIQLKQKGKTIIEIFLKISPALTIVWLGFMVWLNVMVSKPLFRLRGLKYPDFEPMDKWQTPEFLVWGLIVAGFAYFLPIDNMKWIAINAIIVICAIYAFHGISIVLFLMNKFKAPSWARFGLLLILSTQLFFWIALSMAGLFDQWIDFRKIHRHDNMNAST